VHVFPEILWLSIDIDKVTQELFRPATLQIIHHFTFNRRYESPETAALLDACVDALTQAGSGPLRGFAADALAEFLQWTIKRTPSEVSRHPYIAWRFCDCVDSPT
jgi:DNA-dependent protein kinase catalytic subunit